MRVVIASLPIGTGHDVAARALAEAFVATGAEVGFSHHLVASARWQTALYFLSLRYVPWLYGEVFRREDRRGAHWAGHRRWWRGIGRRILTEVFLQQRPDVVICTHPFALTAWSAIREEQPNLRLVGVLTDLSVHRFWYEPLADAYTVWLPEQVEDLCRLGVDRERIWSTGIPIRASFQQPNGFWGFKPPPVVLLGGGLGMGPYYRILRQLSELPWPILAVCGHNERLRWQLSEHRWPASVAIEGYVENMPLLLKNARLVVGKPGGVTAAEVAQSQVPFLLTHWIPGQEEVNRDRLVAHQLAMTGQTNLVNAAAELLNPDSAVRARMLAQQQHWARPQAARDIRDYVARLVGSP